MEVPEHIKRFAEADGFPMVKPSGSWKEYDLYVASDPEAPFVGPPQIILVIGEEVRWATLEETEAIS